MFQNIDIDWEEITLRFAFVGVPVLAIIAVMVSMF
jgi:hypothetical protein